MARKKLCLCPEGLHIGINWMIAILKHKRNRKFDFFSVKSFLFHSWTTKVVFSSWLFHLWKYYFWCSFGEIKFHLALKKSDILHSLLIYSATRSFSLSIQFKCRYMFQDGSRILGLFRRRKHILKPNYIYTQLIYMKHEIKWLKNNLMFEKIWSFCEREEPR